MLQKVIHYLLHNWLITMLLLLVIIIWGISTAPFNWYSLLPRDPVPVDAIPDIGDNQQIVAIDELRTLQDFYVKYTLSSAEGVAEVASVGGFVKEYQVEINPKSTGRAGYRGDGMIAVSSVEEAHKVRDDESGILAI